FLAGRYAGMTGDPVAAADFYRRSFDRSPEDASLLERAMLSTLIAGGADEAIALAVGADPAVSAQSPTAQFALAVNDVATGKHKRAAMRLKKGGMGAINADAAGFLASWLMAADDADAGLEYLDQLPPRRLLAGEQQMLRGLILANAGRTAEALATFEQASRLPTGSPGYLLLLRAQLTASTGDLAGARKLVEQQVEELGVSAETEYALSLINSGKAVPHPKFGVREGAAVAVFLASAGGVARSRSEIATMRHATALYLDPGFAPARLMLADAMIEQDRQDDALADLGQIPGGSIWAADARLKEAWIFDRLDRPAEALAAAEAALASSRRRDVLIGAGDLYRLNRNDKAAVALYDEVIAADTASGGRDWRVLFARASARNGMGDWKGTEADLLAALAIEPDRPELQNFLGYGWVNRGERVDEGMDLIRKAVAARPDQGYIVDSLGWAHYALGQYDQAVEALERAAELSPSDPEIVDHLGDAYWRAGRQTEAAFEWRRALQLDPDDQREATLKTKLQRGLAPASTTALADAKARQ
ncbi:MAG TPA: tetratricopeptide repeat protein, partial [Hyphomonadaceae bacterium]|nr:tetratricopeptide repeat protein [Hyphomonadaceae bacterium]